MIKYIVVVERFEEKIPNIGVAGVGMCDWDRVRIPAGKSAINGMTHFCNYGAAIGTQIKA